ncbi:Spy0128 family protein [Bifidobacterium mellis]|uniref:Putative cell surface protein n=1 Tax=Bifidobacterium mellis TaxID=1293823 RepID=A0A0F4L0B7_9BIFI|nr:FctA domain-containing protein [Bifidobacterium mellis]KJY52120.1 putative cell surface protein [Bifidobacterium mellis]
MAKGNLSGKVLAGLMAMAMLIPTMAIADSKQTADAQTAASISTSPTTRVQQATATNQTSSTSTQTSTPQLDTATSGAAQTTQKSKSTPSNQAAAIQPSRKPTAKSAIKDMLDTDDAVVTTLSQASRSTGTAPFDKDNNPGNDHDADNDIVRTFDKLSYTYSFAVNTRSETTSYRRGRIGFQFKLNQPEDRVTFDVDSMGWVDNTPGYQPKQITETIDGQPTQVLTVYRLLTATENLSTVIPGSSSVTLVLRVRSMPNGSKFAPEIQAWGAPDAITKTDPASATSDSVTVSAKLNLNLRITGGTNEGSGNQTFDFNTPAAGNYPNHELGKRKGIISKFNWAVDMRWPDRTKGLKGLEAPIGPITFSLSLSNLWQTAGGDAYPKIEDLQPYFWDIGTIDGDFNNSGRNTGDQGWRPTLSNYGYARSTGGTAGMDRVQGNGQYTVAEQRSSQGLRLDLTLKDYETNDPFPYLGHTYARDTKCTPALASTDCTRQEVAEISTGYLYVFNPSTVGDKDVANYYGQTGLSLQSKVDDGDLSAKSLSNQSLPPASGPTDTSNQTDQSDDMWHNVIFTQGSSTIKAGISNIIQYSCMTASNYFDDGVDCGWWTAPDNLRGTDSAVAGTQVRVTAGFNFKTSKADLPLLGMSLVKIDPKVVGLPADSDGLDLPWVSGIWQNSKYDVYESTSNQNPLQDLVMYATKSDGKDWKNDTEQANADIEDLNFYSTQEEAKKHGMVVGMLLGGRTAAPSRFAEENSRFGFGGFVINVLPDAKVGSVAQLTSVSRTFTRSQLAAMAGLDPENSSDQEWEDWARKQNPYDLAKIKSPDLATSVGGYTKARYDQMNGYLGGDTGGNEHGDSLYIAGETNTISNAVAQTSTNSRPKEYFDIDSDQRFVDWRLTINTGSSASQANKGAQTELYITDKLPAKLHYIPGSARLGGTYTEATPEMGHIEGGTACEPSVSTDSATGITTLSWTLTNIPVDGNSRVIHFSTSLGDLTDPGKDIGPNEDLTTSATVQSKYNMSQPNTYLKTADSFTIHAWRTNTTSLSTSAVQDTNEAGAPIGFTNMLSSTPGSGKQHHYAIDIMPYKQTSGKPDFHGEPTFADMSIKASAGAGLSGVTIRYTTDSRWRVNDTSSIQSQDYLSWDAADLNPTSGEVKMPENAVAWAFIIDGQPNQFRYEITFHINPGNNSSGDRYRNRWGNALNQMPAQAMVVQRSISGIVWYDVNGDGIRSSEDILLKDVKVTLFNDTDDKPAKSVVTPHDDLSTKSDSRGKYELTNIPAGKFHLRFDPAPNTNWTHLTTTIQKADTATQSENSSASDFLEDGTMKGAVINDIEFQKAEDMVDAASQSLDFNNCGLTGMMDTDEVSAGVEVRIQGRNWLGTDSFALNVEPLDGAPSAALPSQITINADNQNTQVPVNVYDLPGDGGYRYRIHQETGSIPGLTYDQNAAILTITLTTDAARLHRTAKAQWTDSKGSKIDTVVFTNTYQAKPATVKLTAFKHLEGRDLKAGEFDFLLQNTKGGKPTQASNKANGTVEFPEQTLSEAGDYTYSVSEARGSLPGITYDQDTHQITVHVTDDQQGQLQTTVTGNNPTFTNTYQAKPDKPDNPDDPGNSAGHDKPNPPVEPSKPSESDHAPSKPDQTGSNSQKTAPGSQSSDGQAKSSTDSQALAASGSDPVIPAALTFGTAVLGLALMCLPRHRRDREADLG